MSSISFEWDHNKLKVNSKKHHISFEEAKSVFYDENAIEYYDPDHSIDEDRFILLGMSSFTQVLVVCHCLRNENIIRIISARKATKKEATVYYGGLK